MSSDMNKLCVILLPKSVDQIIKWLPNIGETDIVELRLDYFKEIDYSKIMELTKIPFIVTFRSQKEGGYWGGSDDELIHLLQQAINQGVAYIDIEWVKADIIIPKLQLTTSTQLILSHHTKIRDTAFLQDIFRKMLKINAQIYKLIYTASELNDSLITFKLIGMAKKLGVKYIVHAMGELGTVSRLWGAVLGNAWSFVSLSDSDHTASGQISLQSARNDYFLPEKTKNVRLVGLIGYPIVQSCGWRLHNRLLNYKKKQSNNKQIQAKDFLYVNFPVQHFQEFWEKWENLIFGLSVTLPLKQSVISHLSIIPEEIKNSGVCNTIYRTEAGWAGRNTDLLAIEKLLEPYKKQLQVGVLIIGTGATAKSSIAAVKRLGGKNIILTGRNLLAGRKIAKLLSVQFLPENKLKTVTIGCIIQTTPLGMFPKVDELPPGTDLFKENMVVLDVIYNPELTKFLRLAQEHQCIIISGKEMFLQQATYQFEIYSGISTSIEEMRLIWKEL